MPRIPFRFLKHVSVNFPIALSQKFYFLQRKSFFFKFQDKIKQSQELPIKKTTGAYRVSIMVGCRRFSTKPRIQLILVILRRCTVDLTAGSTMTANIFSNLTQEDCSFRNLQITAHERDVLNPTNPPTPKVLLR